MGRTCRNTGAAQRDPFSRHRFPTISPPISSSKTHPSLPIAGQQTHTHWLSFVSRRGRSGHGFFDPAAPIFLRCYHPLGLSTNASIFWETRYCAVWRGRAAGRRACRGKRGGRKKGAQRWADNGLKVPNTLSSPDVPLDALVLERHNNGQRSRSARCSKLSVHHLQELHVHRWASNQTPVTTLKSALYSDACKPLASLPEWHAEPP